MSIPKVQLRALGLTCLVLVMVIRWPAAVAQVHLPEWLDPDGWSGGAFGDPGVDGQVSDLIAFTPNPAVNPPFTMVYAAGSFTNAGGNSNVGIARWNGTRWWTPANQSFAVVNKLAIWNGGAAGVAAPPPVLIAAGSFPAIGGVVSPNIAAFTGAAWLPLGNGLPSEVFAVAVSGGIIYASTNAGGGGGPPITSTLWAFVGGAWAPVAVTTGGTIQVLADLGGVLHAGGDFGTIGGNSTGPLAALVGTNWEGMGAGPFDSVRAMIEFDGGLHAAGAFSVPGLGNTYPHATFHNGWEVDQSVWGFGFALHVHGAGSDPPALYLGGAMPTAMVRVLTTSGWEPLNTDSGWVYGMASLKDKLVVGGSFVRLTLGSHVNARNIATFDPIAMTWDPVTPPAGPEVSALAAGSDGRIYVGGHHTGVGNWFSGLARWDCISWERLTSDAAEVSAIVPLSVPEGLVVGGGFSVIGGVNAQRIAVYRFDTETFSPLGGGLIFPVDAIAVNSIEPAIYAGGFDGVHRWNGVAWAHLGDWGDGALVRALLPVTDGPGVVAGGLSEAGFGPSVATHNGLAWIPSPGIYGEVRALTRITVPSAPGVPVLVAGGDMQMGSAYTGPFSGVAFNPAGLGWVWPQGAPADVALYTVATVTLAGGPSALLAGGSSLLPGNVAVWTGGTWARLSSGINSDNGFRVTAITGGDEDGPAPQCAPGVFIGGTFEGVNGASFLSSAGIGKNVPAGLPAFVSPAPLPPPAALAFPLPLVVPAPAPAAGGRINPRVAGGLRVQPLELGDDGMSAPNGLGFPFRYFGENQTSLYVNANGFLSFSDQAGAFSWLNGPIPSAGVPNNAIYALWDDFDQSVAGQITYAELGATGCRIAIADWEALPFYGQPHTSSTFQIRLHESSNCIEIVMADVYPEAFSGDYTIGVEDTGGAATSVPGAYAMSAIRFIFCPEDSLAGPLGACCINGGACVITSAARCLQSLGDFGGVESVCAGLDCSDRAACCFGDGSCLMLAPGACTNCGGVAGAGGSTCEPNECPQPMVACCLSPAGCLVATRVQCEANNGHPQALGSNCDPPSCGAALLVRGDANCDGSVNNFDIDPFVMGIVSNQDPTEPPGYPAGQACWERRSGWGDLNRDGVFNNFDIDPFVACIVALPAPGESCP